MKVKYSKLIKAMNSLTELSEKEMNYGLALKISRNINEIEKHIQDYKMEYSKIMNDCLETDDNGNFVALSDNSFKIKEGKTQEVQENLNTLDNFEAEVNVYTLNADEFQDLKITPAQLLGIDFLVEVEE